LTLVLLNLSLFFCLYSLLLEQQIITHDFVFPGLLGIQAGMQNIAMVVQQAIS